MLHPTRREELLATLLDARQGGTAVALLLVDLDNFAALAERCGTERLGELFSARLAEMLRRGDVRMHLGDGTFAVVAHGISAPGARQLAERLRALLVREALIIDGKPIYPSISIGLAVRTCNVAGFDSSALLSDAEQALKRARDAGGHCVKA
jgi:diguanylate cyclase (GGDEF)-like protein